MKYKKLFVVGQMVLLCVACGGPSSGPQEESPNLSPISLLPDVSQVDPVPADPAVVNPTPVIPLDPSSPPSGVPPSPVVVVPPVVRPGPSTYVTDALLFNGVGVSQSDWQSTAMLLQSEGLSYRIVNSSRLNAMTFEEIVKHGVLIVPGGKGSTITAGMSQATRLRIRQAVQAHGMGYVGFCAGAWVAVGPEASSQSIADYGLAVADGAVLPAYYPEGNTSLIAAMVKVRLADGNFRHLVWWGGPATPEWEGGVVARYENGLPAISETFSGKGYVVISGPHPEAPEGWRDIAGNDVDGLDFDLAAQMIRAALSKAPLAAF